jgi:hypothetical protein
MFSFNANDKQAFSDNFLEMKLFSQYFNLAKVFNEKTTNILFKHDSQNLAIDTQNVSLSFKSFYKSQKKNLKYSKNILTNI